MDFGDILKKWEDRPQSSKKSDMETWLEKNEVIDKDAINKSKNTPGEKRRHLLNAKPDEILDIHGFTSEEAWISLEQFFQKAKENNYEKLRIIHGKGNHTHGEAILKNTVRKFIEQCAFAGESGYEKSSGGGSGATWVLLKN